MRPCVCFCDAWGALHPNWGLWLGFTKTSSAKVGSWGGQADIVEMGQQKLSFVWAHRFPFVRNCSSILSFLMFLDRVWISACLLAGRVAGQSIQHITLEEAEGATSWSRLHPMDYRLQKHKLQTPGKKAWVFNNTHARNFQEQLSGGKKPLWDAACSPRACKHKKWSLTT